MNLIDYNSFVRIPFFIPQLNKEEVRHNCEDVITYYEPIILKLVLGNELYQELLDNLDIEEGEEVAQKWAELRDICKKISQCYCYYWYNRTYAIKNMETGSGTVQAQNVFKQLNDDLFILPINTMDDIIQGELILLCTNGEYESYKYSLTENKINGWF